MASNLLGRCLHFPSFGVLGMGPRAVCMAQASTLPTELQPQLLKGAESDLIIIRVRVVEEGV